MDELIIMSGFMKTVVSKGIQKFLKKKASLNASVKLNGMKVSVNDDTAHVHLDIEADLQKDELAVILATVGLY